VLTTQELDSITGSGTRLPTPIIHPGDSMNFDIKTEQLGDDAYVIALAGEVDLYTAPEFKQQLLDVIGQGGKEVVVDFSDTTFIDSTTLGVLVGGVKRLRTNDGQLSLVCSDRNITKIFEITGLDRVFAIYPTRDEAVAKLRASADQPPA
jgi:anti-sigma B factor antagonist